jgi:SynChlorMet cassette radical SAM/SPASM protein ScmF
VEILQVAQEMGVRARIESNGTLITEETAARLGCLDNIGHVAISLDGATAASHALLRGSEGSFHAAIRGVRYLIQHGVRVQFITAVYRGNAGEIGEIARLATELGVRAVKLNPVVQMGRGADMAVQGQLLELPEVLDLSRRVGGGAYSNGDLPIRMSLPVAFLSLDMIREQALGECGVMTLLGVLPDGGLSICGIGEGNKQLIFGHARQEGIKEVWTGSPQLQAIRQDISKWPTGVCMRCLVRGYCTWGHCRANAYAHFGSLSAPPAFCHEAYVAGLFPASRLL